MKNINKYYPYILVGILSFILNISLYTFGAYGFIESKFFDLKFKLRGPLYENIEFQRDVVIVEINDESYGLIDESYPYPRGRVYSRVIENLTKAKPDLIISQEICEVCSAYTNQVNTAIEILEAQEALIEKWGFAARGVQPFYPVWGHEALPKAPIDLIGEGSSSAIPLLIGTNEDEMSLYGFTDLDEGTLFRYVERIVDNPKEVIDSYRERVGDDSGWLACAIGSDWVFRIPAIRLAETRENHDGNTWMYLFSWDSRAFEGRFGSAHSLELPFTFNTLDRAGVNIFIGEGELPTHVAEAMHDAWISFIRDGDPSTAVLGEWPTYTTENRAVMEINDNCDLLIDPQSEERSLWDGVR